MATVRDMLVVGGGVNGAGIARDAAGRGLSVLLVEQADLGGATSAASSKLVHGGLRYLEHYEFRLVRESLREREVLLRLAPHIVWPLRFVLPHHSGLRPAWLLRAGLFLYDHLGGRERLPGTRTLRLATAPAGKPLLPRFAWGFEYSDCWVEDSRLVVLNARDAADRRAEILTRTRLAEARRDGGLWVATLATPDGSTRQVAARSLVNAGGPWVDRVRGALGRRDNRPGVRLVKGSHIVLPRLYDGPWCYTLQGADGRVVFTIPYEGRFTLVGTTDVPFDGDPATAAASPAEVRYLCDVVGQYFRAAAAPGDVVWSFAGVRPLHDDGSDNPSAVTRDYVLDLEAAPGEAPCLTIHGGKITTYRRLAEDALARLLPALGRQAAPWTATAPLPGGDMPGADFDRFLAGAAARYPFLPPAHLRRLARAYGTRVGQVLGEATAMAGLGRDLGGITEAELDYLHRAEWARTADDVLWRRSKLGLHLGDGAKRAVADWFPTHAG